MALVAPPFACAEESAPPAEPMSSHEAHDHDADARAARISLYLTGVYGQLQQDPAMPATGFALSPNNANLEKGFNLKESELIFSGAVNPRLSGLASFALTPAGVVTVENAYLDSTLPGHGTNLRFGRFFSEIGLLNPLHAHHWDFVDQPLIYRTLWDNQLGDDGVQLKWRSDTESGLEFGGELGRGRGFPGTDRNKNGAGAGALFARLKGSSGPEQHWRISLSAHQTRQADNLSTGVPDLPGTPGGVAMTFSGDVRTLGAGFQWQQGDEHEPALRLQGEYFRRQQNGVLTYALLTPSSYALTQSGGYLQGVHTLRPEWRLGLRYDWLDAGSALVGAANAANVISRYGYLPHRLTVMCDYGDEGQRIRLQLAQDRSRQNLPDNQLLLQYVMRIGDAVQHSH
jgi:hypothetical protein